MRTLHGYWSTNPMKIRLALAELGEPWEDRTVDLAAREHRSPEFLALNPRGKVPVLVDDGAAIWESGAILAWLVERTGRLFPREPAARAQAWSLLFYESAVFQDPASEFFGYHVVAPTFGRPRDEAGYERAQKPMARCLDLLEGQIGEREWLAGEFSVVDCAFAPWFTAIPTESHPRLRAWFHRMKARSSWTSLDWKY
jgi:GST-like protein